MCVCVCVCVCVVFIYVYMHVLVHICMPKVIRKCGMEVQNSFATSQVNIARQH